MPGTSPPRPLVVTEDPLLLEDLLRLAAVAGTEPDVAPASGSARDRWSTAPAVLVGVDSAPALVRAGLPRRENVVLLGQDPDDGEIWRLGVALGAARVGFLPDAETWLIELLADAADGRAPTAPVVGVVGGRGGAGATALAVALAATAARQSRRVLLVDADPLGGGIDLVLGAESASGMRWPQLAGTRGRVPGGALTGALPRAAELDVLSWDRGDALSVPPDAMTALLSAAERGHELVVVDLPRRLDDAARVALERAAVTLLLVPAEVRAAAAAARVATAVSLHCQDLRVVVRGPAPAGVTAEHIAASLGLPLAARLRPEPGLALTLERGEPPGGTGRGPLAAFCSQFLADLLPASGRRAA